MNTVRSKALVLAAATASLLAGCSGGDDEAAPSPAPSATASPTTSPTPVPRDPLTGGTVQPGPVVAVKVDNAVLARPYQRGLSQAAVVYQELVEGGSTRFMALFESLSASREVGPIRSARESDLDVLRAFGKPALAFSGAQPGVFALVRQAARAGRVIDASYDSAPGLYRLGERRRDARNFFAVPSRIGQRRGGSSPRDVGLRFGPAVPGTVTTSAAASFSPQATVRVRYDASSGTYTLSQGSRVIPFHPENVVVQVVTTQRSRFHDVNGMNTPLTITTGAGRAVVLRDGQRYDGTWRRAGYGATRYLSSAGTDVALRPGRTWVMLLPKAGSLSFG